MSTVNQNGTVNPDVTVDVEGKEINAVEIKQEGKVKRFFRKRKESWNNFKDVHPKMAKVIKIGGAVITVTGVVGGIVLIAVKHSKSGRVDTVVATADTAEELIDTLQNVLEPIADAPAGMADTVETIGEVATDVMETVAETATDVVENL